MEIRHVFPRVVRRTGALQLEEKSQCANRGRPIERALLASGSSPTLDAVATKIRYPCLPCYVLVTQRAIQLTAEVSHCEEMMDERRGRG